MTTGTAKYSKPACSFCGAGDEECGLLIQVEDKNIFICNQCVRAITALLKANPGRKHLRYLPKRNKKSKGGILQTGAAERLERHGQNLPRPCRRPF